jgi:polysaccharide biosynthesis protein PslE
MNPAAPLPSLREIVAVGLHNKRPLLFALILPALAALVIAYSITPVYLATSKILVRSGREFMPQIEVGDRSSATPTVSMQETIDTEVQILNSTDLLREVVRVETPTRLYPQLLATNQSTLWQAVAKIVPFAVDGWHQFSLFHKRPPIQSPEDLAVEAFAKDLAITPVKLSNVVAISFRNPDRAVAADALRRLIARFQERHVEAFGTRRSPVLEEQVAANLAQLTLLEKQRAEYRNMHKLFSVGEQRSALIQQRAKEMQELQDAEIKHATLLKQVQYLQSQIATLPHSITLETGSQESPVTQDTRRRLNELTAQQSAMLTQYGEHSPFMESLQAKIASNRASLATSSNRTSSVRSGLNPLLNTVQTQLITTETDLAPLDVKIADLKSAIASLDGKLREISTTELSLLDLDRRIGELELATNTLRQKLEEARFLDDLDRARIASLSVIEEPTALPRPVYPQKRLFVAAGLLVGLMLASLWLLLAITFGKRFFAVETVERVLGVPVFVTLPLMPLRAIPEKTKAPRGREHS